MIFLMAPASEGGEGGGTGFMIMMGLMFVVMYFFMIRPQVKKQKKQQEYRTSLGKGTSIVTTGGIHGKIVDVKESTFILETEGGGKLRIEKTGVSMEATTALGSNK
ncbi:MAG: preprotein translocase subunit YajC [Bacteroidia bacterium]|jgi:preprotein translocase subunit YajC